MLTILFNEFLLGAATGGVGGGRAGLAARPTNLPTEHRRFITVMDKHLSVSNLLKLKRNDTSCIHSKQYYVYMIIVAFLFSYKTLFTRVTLQD